MVHGHPDDSTAVWYPSLRGIRRVDNYKGYSQAALELPLRDPSGVQIELPKFYKFCVDPFDAERMFIFGGRAAFAKKSVGLEVWKPTSVRVMKVWRH